MRARLVTALQDACERARGGEPKGAGPSCHVLQPHTSSCVFERARARRGGVSLQSLPRLYLDTHTNPHTHTHAHGRERGEASPVCSQVIPRHTHTHTSFSLSLARSLARSLSRLSLASLSLFRSPLYFSLPLPLPPFPSLSLHTHITVQLPRHIASFFL